MGRPRVGPRILLAASELLAQGGVTSLTTRGVAQRAGVTEASVFNNFGDKAGLINALLREQLSEFTLFSEALAQPAKPDLSAWLGQVFITARNYFRLVLPLAAPQLSRGPQPPAARTRDSYMGHTALTNRLLELQEQGVISAKADASAVALLLMGAAMHSALTVITRGDDALGGDDSLVTGITRTVCSLLMT